MNSVARLLVVLVATAASLATGCSPPMPMVDAGPDVRVDSGPPRNDLINLNCVRSDGAQENAADCNARLMSLEGGATFFIGDRTVCGADPNSEQCVPLCELSAINAENCSFEAPGTGCRFRHVDGYSVVVSAGGHRWTAAVGMGAQCSSTAMGIREWARVGIEDLQGAARCAASMPAGGFGPERYGECETPMAACGDPMATPADTCSELMFMAGMTSYTANLCTHACSADAECGARGVCFNSLCWGKCGGVCGISCPARFSCTMPMGASQTLCFPDAPQ